MANNNILLESGTNELEILEFTIAGNSYGINVAKVKELMQQTEVQPMPNSHPCVEGVFQPRDTVYTVLNLPKYLHLSEESDGSKDIFIITSFNKMNVAFHVHSVESIHRISWTDIEKPDNIIYGGREGIVTGITKFDSKICSILDFEKIVYDVAPETGIQMSEIDALGKRKSFEKTILIAEDSTLLRKMLMESLVKSGYSNIVSTTNGAEAWNALVKMKEAGGDIRDHVACLISDIEMPQMDGLHLTKKVKEDQVLRKVPVIIFSSLIDDAMRIKCQQVGADAQLSKPEIGRLVTMVDQVVGLHAEERAVS